MKEPLELDHFVRPQFRAVEEPEELGDYGVNPNLNEKLDSMMSYFNSLPGSSAGGAS